MKKRAPESVIIMLQDVVMKLEAAINEKDDRCSIKNETKKEIRPYIETYPLYQARMALAWAKGSPRKYDGSYRLEDL